MSGRAPAGAPHHASCRRSQAERSAHRDKAGRPARREASETTQRTTPGKPGEVHSHGLTAPLLASSRRHDRCRAARRQGRSSAGRSTLTPCRRHPRPAAIRKQGEDQSPGPTTPICTELQGLDRARALTDKAKQLQHRRDRGPRTGCSAPLDRRFLSINRQTHSRQGGFAEVASRSRLPCVAMFACRRASRGGHRALVIADATGPARGPGELGGTDCRRRVAVAGVLLAGDGLAGCVRDLRQRHMVPGRSLVVGLGS